MIRPIAVTLVAGLVACSGTPGPSSTGGGAAGGLSATAGGSSAGGSTSGGSTAGGSTGGGSSAGGSTSGGSTAGGSTAGGSVTAGGTTAGGAGGGSAPGGIGTFVRVGFFNQKLATGPDGRMHLVFDEGAAERVFYGSCAADCFTDAAWNPVQLRSSAQLGVTTVGPYGVGVDASGRVHVLVGSVTGLGSSANAIQYGTCASGCSTAANWTWLDLSSLGPGRSLVGTTRTFMVQSSGAVSFFTNDQGQYFSCAGSCASLANWSAGVFLNVEVLQAVVDGQGVRHALVNKGRTSANELLLGYARCASACTTPSNWQISSLGFLSSVPLFTASLAATSSGRVFMAYNQGVISVSMQDNRKLFVASCSGSTCLDLNTWQSFTMGEPEEGDSGAWVEALGENVVLASTTVTELKLNVCEMNCAQGANWTTGLVVDTSAAIAQVVPPALGSSCPSSATFAAWYPRRPTVGLSPSGVVVVHNPTALVTCPGQSGPATRPPIGRVISTF